MKRVLLIFLFALPLRGTPLLAQDGRVQLSTHLGTNADWSTLLGGQAGLRVASRFTVTATHTAIVGLGTGRSITYWDLSLRALLHQGRIRPYFLAGASRDRGRLKGVPDYVQEGVVLGAGAEAGRDVLRGFAEMRVVRKGALFSRDNGTTDGRFWLGLRIHLGR